MKAKVREVEEAVVEGLDISGRWSRMLESRVLTTYDLEPLERVIELDGGSSMANCFQCAKCTGVCPVDRVAEYSPRRIFRKLQTGTDFFQSPDLWMCTTCANCLRVCPKEVNMIQVMPAAREEAVLAGHVPPELQKAFENTQRYGNPLGESPRKRADWTKDAAVEIPVMGKIRRPVDVLWFVECYPSYHNRGKDASRALSRIFQALDVDFAILGPEEKCSGDSVRMAGEKGLFEMLAEQNVATLGKYEFNRIVVTDPHAFNAFKKHYPEFGGDYEVLHYSQLLAPRMAELPLVREVPYRVTFHDPCYLGRHNGEYDAPRQVLSAIPGVELVEMPHNRGQALCCGGGGGGMWLDGFVRDHQSRRLSEVRVEEALSTGADVLAVACPYEVSRFEDALKSLGAEGKMRVLDIAELVEMAMEEGNG